MTIAMLMKNTLLAGNEMAKNKIKKPIRRIGFF
jgi:hypothetical protein